MQQKLLYDIKYSCLWVAQFLFKWSNIFIAGPHLSGLEFRGQRVTVGKGAIFIGTTIVFEFEGISSQAKEKKYAN